MEQLSLPYRIALVALLVVGALWFVVLRPKSAPAPAPTPAAAPGTAGLANDVSKAKGAVDTSNASAAANEAATNAVGGSTSTTAAATPSASGGAKPGAPAAKKAANPGLADDAAPGDPSRPLLADVDAGKIAVVLFWNKAGSDDRATRDALRDVDRHHGKVVTKAIPVADVGKYEAITRGAQVLESPTVLVIGSGGKARAITGYTEANEIDQAVSDLGGKGFAAKKAFALKGFAATADDVCKDFHYALDQKADPPTTVHELSKVLGIAEREQRQGAKRLANAKAATAGERELKAAMLAFVKKDAGWVDDARHKLKSGGQPANVFLALVQAEVDGSHAYKSAAKKLHVRGCYAAD